MKPLHWLTSTANSFTGLQTTEFGYRFFMQGRVSRKSLEIIKDEVRYFQGLNQTSDDMGTSPAHRASSHENLSAGHDELQGHADLSVSRKVIWFYRVISIAILIFGVLIFASALVYVNIANLEQQYPEHALLLAEFGGTIEDLVLVLERLVQGTGASG